MVNRADDTRGLARLRCASKGGGVAGRGGRSGGFNLLELIMVMAIISTISILAIPRYIDATMRYRADLTAQRIAADLAYARSVAQRTNQNVAVQFSVAADGYEMPAVAHMDDSQKRYGVDLTVTPYGADVTSAAFGSGPVSDTVTFDVFGDHDAGGVVVILVGKHKRSILLDASTGSITIQ